MLGFGGDVPAPIPRSWLESLSRGATVVGKGRYLNALKVLNVVRVKEEIDYRGGFGATIEGLSDTEGPVLILASGDPGFFGPVRFIREAFPSLPLRVSPAPSAISMAFASLGMSWDDATIISALGSRATQAQRAILGHLRAGQSKIAVMCSPELDVGALTEIVRGANVSQYRIEVVANIGTSDEQRSTIVGPSYALPDKLSTENFAIAIICRQDSRVTGPTLEAGKVPDTLGATPTNCEPPRYISRGEMITKAEIRSIVIAKLAPWTLPFGATIWDVGAGSGSVGLDILAIRPDLDLIAIERAALECEYIARNALGAGLTLEVVHNDISQVAAYLRPPTAVFVGGGGMDALEAVLAIIDPQARVTATAATLETAIAQQKHLADQVLVQVHLNVALGPNGHRLDPYNPVFISSRKAKFHV